MKWQCTTSIYSKMWRLCFGPQSIQTLWCFLGLRHSSGQIPPSLSGSFSGFPVILSKFEKGKITPCVDYTNHALPLNNKQVNVFILMLKKANCKSNMGVDRALLDPKPHRISTQRETIPSQPSTLFNASSYNIYPRHMKNLRMLLSIWIC